MFAALDRFLFILSETLQGLRRNPTASAASVATATIALALLGGFVLLAYGLHQAAEQLPDKFQTRIVMKIDATPKQIKAVDEALRADGRLKDIVHNTKEQNWEWMKSEYKDIAGDLSDLDNDMPTNDDFYYKVKDLKDASDAAKTYSMMAGVEAVRRLEPEEEAALRLSHFVPAVGLFLALLLTGCAAVLIGNTARLTMLARAREIRIMRLVGATPSVIRAPFSLEGVLHGCLGGFMAFVILYISLVFLAREISTLAPINIEWTTTQALMGLLSLMLAGSILGGVSGAAAAGRHLK